MSFIQSPIPTKVAQKSCQTCPHGFLSPPSLAISPDFIHRRRNAANRKSKSSATRSNMSAVRYAKTPDQAVNMQDTISKYVHVS